MILVLLPAVEVTMTVYELSAWVVFMLLITWSGFVPSAWLASGLWFIKVVFNFIDASSSGWD